MLPGALSAYAVGLVTSVHSGYATELSHARATQAAEAGLDWGSCRITNGAAASCVAIQTLTSRVHAGTVPRHRSLRSERRHH